jgi:hypothetical protein
MRAEARPMGSPVGSAAGGGEWPASPAAKLALAVAIGAAAVATRLLWDRFLDPFEDGYQNWWISSLLVETGSYADPHGGMTRGNWLPGHHLTGAALISLLGSHPMEVVKASNILLSLATAAVVFLLARSRGRMVAWLAAALFALNPADIVIASFATSESATLLAVFAGVLVVERQPRSWRGLAVASLCFLLAATMRYEAWAFILFYLLWTRARHAFETRGLVLVIAPALAFALAWVAWTSQFGILPVTVFSQTSTDPSFKAAAGTLPPLGSRLWEFFAWYVGWTPLVLLAVPWGLARERASALTWIVVLFYAGEVVYTGLGLGNPGPRYLHLTIPVICIQASSLLVASGAWMRARSRMVPSVGGSPAGRATARSLRARAAGLAPVAVALALSVALALLIVDPHPPPGTMLRGAERAGLYLRDRPLPAGFALYSESPIAAYLTGYPASRMVGPASLPGTAAEAEAFLVEEVAYVVMTTVPYHRMRTLFPELADGKNLPHLRLLYDATGPEYELGAPRVLVYEVVR